MKTNGVFLLLSLLALTVSCAKQKTDGYDKVQALENYNACRQLADDWLGILDSTNYTHLLSIETLKSEDIPGVSSYIDKVQKSYGKIKYRDFIGSHIWSDRKLLTYAPDIDDSHLAYVHAKRSEDGFYIVKPQYFGFASHRQMFSSFPEGDYVILMYEVSATFKPYAEERLTFWHNPQGNWQVVDYRIADEI